MPRCEFALKAIVQVHDMEPEPVDLEQSLTTSSALQKRRVSQGTGNRWRCVSNLMKPHADLDEPILCR